MKVTGQKEIINAVLEALDTSSIGIGIKERYNIKKSNDQVNYSLKFQLKKIRKQTKLITFINFKILFNLTIFII
ncbi:hypothetical protein [Empedobacter sp.]|uniref:hypothetical protein n=1 Tax=Empedobacter sp. TaxID=1927715 RepID=UPI0028AFF8D8|nr:hypothetical protein [Empedobacter sp.]